MRRGKHKTRDNMNEIEIRDNDNFHCSIIFQVFEHCLSVLCSHFDFFIVIWHTLTHTHTACSVFSRMIFYVHCTYSIFTITENAAIHSVCVEPLFFHSAIFDSGLFSFSIKSTFCHTVECGFDIHWYWCFRFDKPSYTIIRTANQYQYTPAQYCVWVFECLESHRTFILRIRLYYLSIHIYTHHTRILYRCWTVSRYYFIVSKCVVLNRYAHI